VYISEWDWRDEDIEHLAEHVCNLHTCSPFGGGTLGIDAIEKIVQHHIR
jgi:hypothetical protein